jgi:hypothetical protein
MASRRRRGDVTTRGARGRANHMHAHPTMPPSHATCYMLHTTYYILHSTCYLYPRSRRHHLRRRALFLGIVYAKSDLQRPLAPLETLHLYSHALIPHYTTLHYTTLPYTTLHACNVSLHHRARRFRRHDRNLHCLSLASRHRRAPALHLLLPELTRPQASTQHKALCPPAPRCLPPSRLPAQRVD